MADGAARAAAAAEVMSSSSSFLCSCDRESHHSLVSNTLMERFTAMRFSPLAWLRCAINEMLHRRVYSSAHLQYTPFHLQIETHNYRKRSWLVVGQVRNACPRWLLMHPHPAAPGNLFSTGCYGLLLLLRRSTCCRGRPCSWQTARRLECRHHSGGACRCALRQHRSSRRPSMRHLHVEKRAVCKDKQTDR